MGAALPQGSPAVSSDDPTIVRRAQALRAELGTTFARLLAALGISPAQLALHVRRLERDPAARRELDAARQEARATTHAGLAPRHPLPPHSRNPRALRA